MDAETTRRRIRAARALADLTVDELAEKIGGNGLSRRTLGNIERGERAVRPMELREIAEACGLPYEFFTIDLAALTEQSTDPTGRTAEQRLEDLEDVIQSLEPRLALLERDRRLERDAQDQPGSPRTARPARTRRRQAGG